MLHSITGTRARGSMLRAGVPAAALTIRPVHIIGGQASFSHSRYHRGLGGMKSLRKRCCIVEVARPHSNTAAGQPDSEVPSSPATSDHSTSSSGSSVSSPAPGPASSSPPPASSTADPSSSTASPLTEQEDTTSGVTQPGATEATASNSSSAPYPYLSGSSAGPLSSGPGGGGGGGGGAVSLSRRVPGIGYTFLLAGMLKILTIGGLAMTAPNEATRTALGKASSYMMVPVGLGMAYAAKLIVDSGLNESKKFLRWMVVVLVVLYFGLVKLLYKYTPAGDVVSRPRPRLPGPLGEVRAQLGDRELLADSTYDGGQGRMYRPERPGRGPPMYDDLAWYEGRYPAAPGGGAGAGEDQLEERVAAAEEMIAASRPRAAAARAAAARRSFLSNSVAGAGTETD